MREVRRANSQEEAVKHPARQMGFRVQLRIESSPNLLQLCDGFSGSLPNFRVLAVEGRTRPYRQRRQLPGCPHALGECSVRFAEAEAVPGAKCRLGWLQSPGSSHSAWALEGIQIRSVLARCVATRTQGKGCSIACSTHLSAETKLYNVVLLRKILGKAKKKPLKLVSLRLT